MTLLKFLISYYALKARAFEGSTNDPVKAQAKVLFQYLSRNRATEYGLKYNFSNIKTIEEYQASVPLCDGDSMRPYLNRMKKGEQNILTVDRPTFFGSTSGTTSVPKLIPSTHFSESKKNALLQLYAHYIIRDHPDTLKGKVLVVVSPAVEGYTESGVPYGAESGHNYKNLPIIARHLYALPYAVFEINDYDARYYAILRIGMEQNITDIGTLNPSTIILLAKKIRQHQDKIIEDIEKGTLNRDFYIHPDIRQSIEKTLRPNLKRAEELKAILRDKVELLPKYFWPNLELIECWKGGTMSIYLKEIPKYFGDVKTRDIGCLSTETRSSIPVSDEGAGGILSIQTNFYEFIPKEDIDKKDKRALLCDQLEKGREYFIVVTTPGGLYRYNIDDLVRVDGFFNKTPIIEFTQKGHNASSLAGEKLYESQVNGAVNKVTELLGLGIEFLCAIPQHGKMPRYIFLVEFANESIAREKKKDFLLAIDHELERQNSEYEYTRRAQLLASPVLKVVKKGDFERYRAKRLQEGAHDTQFKCPELTSDLNFQNNFRIEDEIYID